MLAIRSACVPQAGRWFLHLLPVSIVVFDSTLDFDLWPGTFGGDDFMHSLLGEASDHIVRIQNSMFGLS